MHFRDFACDLDYTLWLKMCHFLPLLSKYAKAQFDSNVTFVWMIGKGRASCS